MSEFPGWDVRHVDLASAPDEWALSGDRRGVFVTFWYGDLPLGNDWIDRNELPLDAAQVAERAARAITDAVGYWCVGDLFAAPVPNADPVTARLRAAAVDHEPLATLAAPLQRARERALAAAATRPTLAVVVCTRDRPESLERTLAALARSREAADDVIVVDNAPSNDDTREVVARFPGVRYVREASPGLSQARNAGVRAARHDLIAFTDDDVEVHPGWTGRVRDALADGRHAAMTGLVLPASLATESEYLFESAFGGFSRGFRPVVFDEAFREATRRWCPPVWQIGAGANMAFRRDVFATVGEFDERLGAGRAGCSEDSEMWHRLLYAGHSCVYDPRSVVFHWHRSDPAALRRQMRAYTRGHVAALFVQFERTGDWGNLRRVFLSLPRYYVMRLVRRWTQVGRREDFTWRQEVAGALAGIGYYLRAPRRRPVPASVTS